MLTSARGAIEVTVLAVKDKRHQAGTRTGGAVISISNTGAGTFGSISSTWFSGCDGLLM